MWYAFYRTQAVWVYDELYKLHICQLNILLRNIDEIKRYFIFGKLVFWRTPQKIVCWYCKICQMFQTVYLGWIEILKSGVFLKCKDIMMQISSRLFLLTLKNYVRNKTKEQKVLFNFCETIPTGIGLHVLSSQQYCPW